MPCDSNDSPRRRPAARIFPRDAAFGLGVRRRIARFVHDTDGVMAVLLVIIFAGLLLVGGLAVDISQLNAQKAYAQGQADLAAQSAATHLQDLDEARNVARTTVRRNDRYGELELQDSQITFGSFQRDTGFVPTAAGETTGINAVRVEVELPWRPLLWSPLFSGDDYVIARSAIASAGEPFAAFTLRNRLLSVDSSSSPLLAPLLADLLGAGGLGLNLAAVGYDGLANATVSLHDLLGLGSVGADLDAVTFDEVLSASVTVQDFMTLLTDEGTLPPGVLGGASLPNRTLQLGQLLKVPDSVLDLNVGDVLPDIEVGAFDLLMVAAGLSGFDPSERLSVATGIDLAPLTGIQAEAGLIRAPVTFAGPVSADNPLSGSISQVDLSVASSALGLLSVAATLSAADADVTLTNLDCSASEPDDILATFTATTGVATLGIDLSLLSPIDGEDAAQTAPAVPIAAHTQQIEIRLDQVGEPVPIPGQIALSDVTSALSLTLGNMRGDLQEDRDETEAERYNRCMRTLFGLGCLLDAVIQVLDQVISELTTVIDNLTNVLASSLMLDGLAQALLDLLGIDVARAEIVLNDYVCAPGGGTLVN